jgi:hypothetical protein
MLARFALILSDYSGVQEVKSRAFLSWLTLANDRLFGATGRLATIWFDELVLQFPSPEMLENVVDVLVSRGDMKSSTAYRLLDCWTPVQRVLPNYHFLGINTSKRTVRANPWGHPNRDLVKLAESVTIEATTAQAPDLDMSDPGFHHEVVWAGAGLIEAVATWYSLNARSPTSIIAEEREDRVIQQLHGRRTELAAFGNFLSVMSGHMSDPSKLSWEEVIDLREHKYVAGFRDKIRQLSGLVKANDEKQVMGLLAEMYDRDLKEIARITRPSRGRALLKAVAGNLPLPLLMNPVSATLSLVDIGQDRRMDEQFGWLYFLLDLER